MRWVMVVIALAGAVGLTSGCSSRKPALGTPTGEQEASAPAAPAASQTGQVTKMTFKITSSAFQDNARIPTRYTGDGANVSPPLAWEKPPEGTASLALIMDDPDAPRGTFTHWVLYGLSAARTDLPEALPPRDTLPEVGGAKQGMNDAGKIGYFGPAPPRGPVHHYHFKLYALDAQLNLPPRARKADLEKAMQGHIKAEARLIGTYSR
jgi:Raf kinase inhibitor-like YbhB/YbcL family protein